MKAQQLAKGKKRNLTKKEVFKPVTSQAESQTFVTITTDQCALILVEHIWRIFDNNICLVGNDVTQVTPNTEFDVIVAKLGKKSMTLTGGQTVASAAQHTNDMMEATITRGEVLGVAVQNLYRKRPCDGKLGNVYNHALAKNREQVFGDA